MIGKILVFYQYNLQIDDKNAKNIEEVLLCAY